MLRTKLKNENQFVFVCKFCKAIYTSLPEFMQHKISQHKKIVGIHELEHTLDETTVKEEPIELNPNNDGALDLSRMNSKTTKIKFPFNKNLDFDTQLPKEPKISKPEISSKPYKSSNCSNASDDQQNLLQLGVEGTNLYSCGMCPLTSKFKCAIVRHRKTHGTKHKLRCKHCTCTYTSLRGLISHINYSHYNIKPVSRFSKNKTTCSRSRKRKNMGGKRRRKFCVKGIPVSCQHCGTLLSSKAKRLQHLKIYHSKLENYKCGRCLFETTELLAMEKHKETSHRASSNIKSTQSPHNVDHMTLQHQENIFQPMVTLERENHSNKPRSSSKKGARGIMQICRICAVELSSLRAYQIHFKEIHAETKPYLCPECPYKCDSPSRLSCHRKLHSRREGFKCKHCAAWFGFKCNMIKHAKLVHGEYTADSYIAAKEIPAAIACSMCQDIFPRFVDLLTHHRNFHAYDKLAYSEKLDPPGYICYPNLDNSEKNLNLQQMKLCSPISDNEIFPELTSDMCMAELTAISRFDIISEF